MPRRRLRHKDVLETIQQDDIQVALGKLKSFWRDSVVANNGLITTTILVVVVLVFAGYYWKNSAASGLANANSYLAEAKTNFDTGDIVGALAELNYVLPGGEYSTKRVSIAAKMLHASVAYASGDYETSISILTELIPDVPSNLKGDLLYELAAAQENHGDHEAALATLEEIVPFLGPQPEEEGPDRKSSVWDRYYYRKGRVLARMGKEAEGIEFLLKVSERSRWISGARSEVAWLKAKPAGALPTGWKSNPSS
jgi:tetratricopeptide (TPR) repeat protein